MLDRIDVASADKPARCKECSGRGRVTPTSSNICPICEGTGESFMHARVSFKELGGRLDDAFRHRIQNPSDYLIIMDAYKRWSDAPD